MNSHDSKPKRPAAPAPYRPQPVPKVLQRKVAAQAPSKSTAVPAAPPIYRPQSTPVVLQRKEIQKDPRRTVTPQPPRLNNIRAIPVVAQRKTNSLQLKQVMTAPRGMFSRVVQRAAEAKAPAIVWDFDKDIPLLVQAKLRRMVAKVPEFEALCKEVTAVHGKISIHSKEPAKGEPIAEYLRRHVYINKDKDMDVDDAVNAIVFEMTNATQWHDLEKARNVKKKKARGRAIEAVEYKGVKVQIPIIKAAKEAGLVKKERFGEGWKTFEEYYKYQVASGHTAYYEEGEDDDRECFITSACVFARGLPDDCEELTTLRTFRDNYIMSVPGGPELVQEYYKIAPGIVASILESPSPQITQITQTENGDLRNLRITYRESKGSEQILSALYDELVVPSVSLILNGEYENALTHYRTWVTRLMTDWR